MSALKFAVCLPDALQVPVYYFDRLAACGGVINRFCSSRKLFMYLTIIIVYLLRD